MHNQYALTVYRRQRPGTRLTVPMSGAVVIGSQNDHRRPGKTRWEAVGIPAQVEVNWGVVAQKSKNSQNSPVAGTPATVALTRAGITFTTHSYEHDPSDTSFGTEAATKLGLDQRRVFKTLMVDSDAGLAIGVVPVDGLLDVKAMAAAIGAKKAGMGDPALAEKKSGYVVGGISPVGQKTPLRTVLDDSALDHSTIFVSGGKRGLDIELAPADLLRITGGFAAAIRRPG